MSSSTLTKRELREQRRTERQAAEAAEAAHNRRRRRLWQLGAAAGLALVAVVVAVAVSSSSGTPKTPAPAKSTLFAGIPEHDGVLGDPKAPLTLTEYVDLQCPVCARESAVTLPTVVRDYIRTGKVRLQARTLHFIGPDSERAARVAAGAEQQGKLFRFLTVFYAQQGTENTGYVTDAFLRRVAAAAGVDAGPALAQADSAFATGRLARADADATRLGVSGTPTLAVSRGGGRPHLLAADALDPQSVARALNAELAR